MKKLVLSLLVASAVLPLSAVAAETFPSRPITIVVPYPPGGNADVALRALAEGMEKQLGVRVRVSPTPGAGGATGIQKALGSRPDGYTILVCAESSITIPSELRNLRFKWDSARYVATIAAPAMYIGVNRDNKDIKTFAQMIAQAKSKPASVNIAQVGKTGLHQLTVLRMNKRLGIDITSIPYNGGPPTVAAVLGGHADLLITDNFNEAIRPLVMTGGVSPHYKGVKSLAELGYPEIAAGINYVVGLPLKTPDAIAQKIEDAMAAAVKYPKYQKILASLKWTPLWRDSQSTHDRVMAQALAARELIKAGTLKLANK